MTKITLGKGINMGLRAAKPTRRSS